MIILSIIHTFDVIKQSLVLVRGIFQFFLARHSISRLKILPVDSIRRRLLTHSHGNSDSRHSGDYGSLVHTYRNYELICVFDKNSNIRITSN